MDSRVVSSFESADQHLDEHLHDMQFDIEPDLSRLTMYGIPPLARYIVHDAASTSRNSCVPFDDANVRTL